MGLFSNLKEKFKINIFVRCMWRDRIKIEERINDLLPSEKERSDFLSDKCCRTIEKLSYAESKE